MDIVYVLGKGSTWRNNELRYSLRSLKNLKHDSVYIVGECPAWANVTHIPCKDHLTRKQLSIFNKIIAAVNDERISEDFIFFSDDYYVLRPCELQYYTNGLLSDHVSRYAGKHRQAMQNTIEIGGGYNFDIHTPFVYNKTLFKEKVSTLDWSKEYVIKSAYMIGSEGVYLEDAKINKSLPFDELVKKCETMDFLSSGLLNPAMMKFLRETFNERCKYEK